MRAVDGRFLADGKVKSEQNTETQNDEADAPIDDPQRKSHMPPANTAAFFSGGKHASSASPGAMLQPALIGTFSLPVRLQLFSQIPI
jgi:hypothetical protein